MSKNSRMNDSRIAARIASGDKAAFAEFLDSYGPRVHRLARRYADGAGDAEDLTQEIFLDLYRSCASFRGESQLATWVYRVALNHCLRHAEKTQKRNLKEGESFDEARHERPDANADPMRHSLQRELSSQVQNALDDLSPLHRDIVILHQLHGLSYAQCSGVLGIPIGTVKSRLSNAFRHLRESLGQYVLGEAEETEMTGEQFSPKPCVAAAHSDAMGKPL